MFVDTTGGDGFAVHFHGQHGIGMDDAFQLEHRVLGEDEMAEDLDTTRGGARTGTDEHQQEEDDPKEGRPGCVIADEEARGGDRRDDAEERLTERGAKALVATKEQHQAYGYAQYYGVEQVGAELLVFQDGERTPTQGEQKQGEVAARQHHKNGNHDLGIVGESPDVGRPCGETTRADGAQRVTEGVIEVHVALIEQKCLQQSEKQVDKPNTPHGMHDAWV